MFISKKGVGEPWQETQITPANFCQCFSALIMGCFECFSFFGEASRNMMYLSKRLFQEAKLYKGCGGTKTAKLNRLIGKGEQGGSVRSGVKVLTWG